MSAPECATSAIVRFSSLSKRSLNSSFALSACSSIVSRRSAVHNSSFSANPSSTRNSGKALAMQVLELRWSHVCTPRRSRSFSLIMGTLSLVSRANPRSVVCKHRRSGLVYIDVGENTSSDSQRDDISAACCSPYGVRYASSQRLLSSPGTLAQYR